MQGEREIDQILRREREREGDVGGDRDRPNLPAPVRTVDRKTERQRAMGNYGEREIPVACRPSLPKSSQPSLSLSLALSFQWSAHTPKDHNVPQTQIFFFFFFLRIISSLIFAVKGRK